MFGRSVKLSTITWTLELTEKCLSDTNNFKVFSDQDRNRQSEIKSLKMLVDAFAVKVRCNFWEKLQEKAVNSNSTTISGQKMPKNSKKSETTTFFDHKKIEMLKFSSVPIFYNDSAF